MATASRRDAGRRPQSEKERQACFRRGLNFSRIRLAVFRFYAKHKAEPVNNALLSFLSIVQLGACLMERVHMSMFPEHLLSTRFHPCIIQPV